MQRFWEGRVNVKIHLETPAQSVASDIIKLCGKYERKKDYILSAYHYIVSGAWGIPGSEASSRGNSSSNSVY